MQMQWLAMIMCLYAGMASARTEEEDQQQASSVSSSLPEPCFYRQPVDCPESDRCPCKRITLTNGLEGNAVLCCNIDKQTLDYGLTCLGEDMMQGNFS